VIADDLASIEADRILLKFNQLYRQSSTSALTDRRLPDWGGAGRRTGL
jgi:hypothetical protein